MPDLTVGNGGDSCALRCLILKRDRLRDRGASHLSRRRLCKTMLDEVFKKGTSLYRKDTSLHFSLQFALEK